MRITAIKCSGCKDTIYSRHVHDNRSCTCKRISIDGGRRYTKISFIDNAPEFVTIDLNVTEAELYLDWNNMNDNYGLIKDT